MDNDTGFENLANAIIVQAAIDYRREYDVLLKRPSDKDAKKRLAQLVDFFYSDYCLLLTKINPDYLIEQIEKTPFAELRKEARRYGYTGYSHGVDRKRNEEVAKWN